MEGFDAWGVVGVGGGSIALTALAAGRKNKEQENTYRLSLDADSSLLGDVRLIGGVASLLASRWTDGTAKKTLQAVAGASLVSLGQTEVIRWRAKSQGSTVKVSNSPWYPKKIAMYSGDDESPRARLGERQRAAAR